MEEKRLEFVGNGMEYFKIWIVNLLLSIVTLGIYSPWAKVRNNAYLYANTRLNGDGFEYTANPLRILIGRLIVFGSYFIYILLGDILGLYIFAGIFALAIFFLIPWFIRQAVKFKMRYTRFRGVNFRHHASIGEHYKFFAIHLILNIVTIFLAFPYTLKEFKKLVLNNTAYGDKDFDFDATTGSFYLLHLKYYGVLFLVGFIAALGFVPIIKTLQLSSLQADPNSILQNPQVAISLVTLGLIAYLVFLLVLLGSKGIWDAWMAKLVYANTTLARFSFDSYQKALKLGWIYASNFILTILSFGLLHPYCKVRMLRYKLANVAVIGEGFDEFTNQTLEDTKALGEESVDFFDIDVGV